MNVDRDTTFVADSKGNIDMRGASTNRAPPENNLDMLSVMVGVAQQALKVKIARERAEAARAARIASVLRHPLTLGAIGAATAGAARLVYPDIRAIGACVAVGASALGVCCYFVRRAQATADFVTMLEITDHIGQGVASGLRATAQSDQPAQHPFSASSAAVSSAKDEEENVADEDDFDHFGEN